MNMFTKFFVCVVVALAAAQCEAASVQDVKANAFLVKFNKWVKGKELQLKNSVKHAAEELKELEQSLVKNAHENLLESVTKVEQDLATWESHIPKNCYGSAFAKLQGMKKTSAADFFHCTNLTKAVADVGTILSKVADMTVTVLELCEEVLSGVEECKPYVSTKGMKCIQGYVLKVIKDFKTDLPLLKDYFTEVVTAGKDLKAQVESCLHPSKAKLNEELTTLLTSLHSCSV
ncbi:uncharacterized protein LOC106669114 [Cimex lectularius]|uniref:Uncharacterized protein n=1 Tax=Cimex lectularius TaxID=79782 RepID=A0A8I6RZX9_CIMLE|nr:uncharacterized protein LOC106669114 [Cimex lectularius]